MADAPEVVPASLDRDVSATPSHRTPVSPESTIKGHETSSYVDDKQAFRSDREDQKIAYTAPETEETNPKMGYEHDDRAGSGMETAYIPAEKGIVTQNAELRDENDWHFGFWESCKPSSLCMESICCPCVLTGRTHMRLHDPKNTHFSSTNGYCMGCFGLCFLGLGAFPLFCFMTTAQRREVRYRYHIKGNNGEDCWKATFCAWCSLVQEEREVVWREEQKKSPSAEQLGRRNEAMTYAA